MAFNRVLLSALLTLMVLLLPGAAQAITTKKTSAKKTTIAKKPTTTRTVSKKTINTAPLLRKTSLASRAVASRFRQRNSPYAGFWTVPNFADATEGRGVCAGDDGGGDGGGCVGPVRAM